MIHPKRNLEIAIVTFGHPLTLSPGPVGRAVSVFHFHSLKTCFPLPAEAKAITDVCFNLISSVKEVG